MSEPKSNLTLFPRLKLTYKSYYIYELLHVMLLIRKLTFFISPSNDHLQIRFVEDLQFCFNQDLQILFLKGTSKSDLFLSDL